MTNANTTATSATAPDAGTPASAPAKRVQAFYSESGKTPVVSLWVSDKTKDTSPDYDGTINGVRVFGHEQTGPKSNFVSFKNSDAGKDANGHYQQVATGNIIAGPRGIPKLVLKVVGMADPLWVECSLKLARETLVRLGLDEAKLDAKKAEHNAAKALKAAADASTAPAAKEEVAQAPVAA